jgi:triosephosphate isomerase
MRTPMIAANWKMNTTVSEALNLVNEIKPEIDSLDYIEIVICPPFISLIPVFNLIKGTHLKLGAQNQYFEDKGAYTGEISPVMLSGYCEYVIIGHSERRQFFQEDGGIISKKVSSAMKHNLKPILCVGENLNEYEAGKTRYVVSEQLDSSLEGVNRADNLTIAYEPVWAIGTGKAATGKQANHTAIIIRKFIEKKYNREIADNMHILYGGSVTAVNITEFVSQPDIDGALVGGASLKAKEFISITKQTMKIRK